MRFTPTFQVAGAGRSDASGERPPLLPRAATPPVGLGVGGDDRVDGGGGVEPDVDGSGAAGAEADLDGLRGAEPAESDHVVEAGAAADGFRNSRRDHRANP